MKSFDGSFIVALLGSSNAPIPSKIASSPLYAAIESLIIGIIIIAIILAVLYMKSGRARTKTTRLQ